MGVQLDLESSDGVAAAAETIIAQLGPHGLDALINCAGVLVDSPVELIPDDELRRAFEVNVIGPMSLTRQEAQTTGRGGQRSLAKLCLLPDRTRDRVLLHAFGVANLRG